MTLDRPTTETTADGAAPAHATVRDATFDVLRDRATPLLVDVAVEPDPTFAP